MKIMSSIAYCGYTFEGPFSSTDDLQNLPGIYVIVDMPFLGLPTTPPIDVGESDDVRRRVEQHDRTRCWLEKQRGTLAVAAMYMPLSTPEQRRAVESLLRRFLAPLCGER